jgi:hypothetical protein
MSNRVADYGILGHRVCNPSSANGPWGDVNGQSSYNLFVEYLQCVAYSYTGAKWNVQQARFAGRFTNPDQFLDDEKTRSLCLLALQVLYDSQGQRCMSTQQLRDLFRVVLSPANRTLLPCVGTLAGGVLVSWFVVGNERGPPLWCSAAKVLPDLVVPVGSEEADALRFTPMGQLYDLLLLTNLPSTASGFSGCLSTVEIRTQRCVACRFWRVRPWQSGS